MNELKLLSVLIITQLAVPAAALSDLLGVVKDTVEDMFALPPLDFSGGRNPGKPILDTTHHQAADPKLEADKLQRLAENQEWLARGIKFAPERIVRRSTTEVRPAVAEYHGFDVLSNQAVVEKFSLTNLTSCAPRPGQYHVPVKQEVIILYRNDRASVEVLQCRITISKINHFCDDFFGHSYGQRYVAIDEMYPVDATTCREMHEKGYLDMTYREKRINLDLSANGHGKVAFFAVGGLSKEGWCETRSYVDDQGVVIDDSMLEIILEAKITRTRASVTADQAGSPRLAIPSPTGSQHVIITNYTSGFMADKSLGTNIWNYNQTSGENCTHHLFTILTHGHAMLYQAKSEYHSDGSRNYILHREHQTPGRTKTASAFILTGPIDTDIVDCQLDQHLTGYSIESTHIDRVFAAYRKVSDNLKPETFHPFEVDTENLRMVEGSSVEGLNLASSLAFITISSADTFSKHLSYLEGQLCMVRRELLLNSVHDLVGAKNKLALKNLFGPGTLLMVRGSTVYVVRGEKVRISLRAPDKDHCTQEIPVFMEPENGTRIAAYLDSFTLLIKSQPQNITCDKSLRAEWEFFGLRLCSDPGEARVYTCTDPSPPLRLPTFNQQPPPPPPMSHLSGLEARLINTLQYARHRYAILTSLSVDSATSSVVNERLFNRFHIGMANPFSGLTVSSLTDSIGAAVNPLYSYLNPGIIGCLVLMGLFTGTCLIIRVVLRLCYSIRQEGFTRGVIRGFFWDLMISATMPMAWVVERAELKEYLQKLGWIPPEPDEKPQLQLERRPDGDGSQVTGKKEVKTCQLRANHENGYEGDVSQNGDLTEILAKKGGPVAELTEEIDQVYWDSMVNASQRIRDQDKKIKDQDRKILAQDKYLSQMAEEFKRLKDEREPNSDLLV